MKNSVLCRRAAHLIGAVAVVGVMWVSLSPEVTAQGGVQINLPAPNAVLVAGPDFATDVLGDAWDMNNAADISKDPEQRRGWTNFGFSGGRVGGTTDWVFGNQVGSSLTIHERAYHTLINPGKNGASSPIPSGVYTKLSIKMGSARGDQFPRVYWFHNDLGHPGGEGVGGRGANTPPNSPAPAGDSILVADLTQFLDFGNPWAAAPVRGLTLYPNNSAVGYNVNFDWVRLTTADEHPAAAMQQIAWSGGSGTSTVQVIDAGGTVMTIGTGGGSGSINWNYGVLPPGTYTLRITSGASQANRTFRINAPPTLRITDPDETGGEDFATAVLGNSWDMNDGNDVRLEVPGNHLLGPSFSGGQFHAVSDGQPVAYVGDIPVGDPIVYALANNGVVNTSRYRYLTYRLQVDRSYDLGRGSVARVFWGSQSGAPYNLTTTKDILVWPGMNSYTVDLASLSAAPGGGLEPGNAQLWTSAGARYLRLDPHEFAEQVPFHVDSVKLAAMDEDVGGTFTIRFTGSDPDGDPVSLALYYDTDRNPSNGLTLIASNVSLASGEYTWNTTGVPPGVYYIYAFASDDVNGFATYSTGPVRVVNFTPVSDPWLSLDGPPNAFSTGQPFYVAGWAIDRGAPSGTGVDAVHVYAYANGTGPGIFLGSSYGQPRGDVGAAFGARYTNSGYSVLVASLRPGPYTISAYSHSTVSGGWQVRSASITVVAEPILAVDGPISGSTIAQPFAISGWSTDSTAASGTGVDTVHVWAYPNPGSGQAPIFAGIAQYGISRPDVGAVYGSRFTNSGYSLTVRGLPPGPYQFSIFSHSTATGTFNIVRAITLNVQNATRVSIDTPTPGTRAQPFTLAGWALDLGSASGTGVDAIHVWAYPTSGQPARWVGAANYGLMRPDVAAVFGSSRFGPSGYSLTVSGLPSGTYDIVAYAHSVVSNSFDGWKVVRVTIP
jgi:hypothetical protein